MKKQFWFVLILLVCFDLQAKNKAKQPNPAYVGVHGMVLMAAGSRLHVSLMPQYTKPHNVQLVYSASAKEATVVYLTKDAELVTIKPEPFNLQRLLSGESFTVTADVYLGHYKRGGVLTHPKQQITFDELLYKRSLKDLPEPSNVQVYDQIKLRNDRILIHQIQKAPSYDHLVLVLGGNTCFTKLNMNKPVPQESHLLQRLSFCGSLKPLYYEAANFTQK